MTREDFVAVQKRLHDAWSGHVEFDKRDVERMLNEIRWLRRRLQRVEYAVVPLADDVRRIAGID